MSARDVSTLCIGPDGAVRDAVACIDRGRPVGIALVVDAERRLLNTVTDGDVRRGILAGLTMASTIGELLAVKAKTPHPRPVTAPAGTKAEDLLALLQQQRIRQVPLVDAEGRVADVVILSDLLPQGEVPPSAVIMAGGFGRRLAPLTEHLPKPMLPVNGRPVMELIVEHLKESGITSISVTTHYMPEKIREHFGDGRSFGVEIRYVNEDRPLGTGGALGLLPPPVDTLLVVNGDVLTEVDYRVMLCYHRLRRADMTVAVAQYGLQVPYGTLECEGERVKCLREKPEMRFLINAGIYLLEPSVYRFIQGGEAFDMTDLIQRLLEAERCVVGFPIFERWLDIGRHDDYRRAQDAGRQDRKD